jgi:excinuclease ABC subunit A
LPGVGLHHSEVEPRLFSFNNPFGACPACGGLGVEQHIDADLVIPDKDKTLRGRGDRAVGEIDLALLHPDAAGARQALQVHARHQSGRTLPKKTQDALLNGSGEDAIRFVYDDGLRSYPDHETVRRRGHQSRAALARD